ncbi:MAG: carbohydrate ABC transporter permease [Chloroflexi bacterium]|nr:MAG: carbohydrate ABC transporter permease [Chloroflexota bacterium]TMF01372.1 MAG: carbohydrate ABC transporter permease [Chloroflexota bacterium]
MGDVLDIRSLRSVDRLLLFLLLLVLAVVAVFPFYWMVIGSLMAPADLFATVPKLWPPDPDLSTYRRIFEIVPLARYFANSLVVSVTTTVVAVIVASAAGYCFARLTFFGKGILFALILAALMVPSQSTIVPLFVMFANWNLLNSYAGIILPGVVSAFGVFMMTQFFRSLPPDMREAAIVDGASEYRIFARIYLPLARPAVATLSLFVFMGTWDQLLWPMIVAPNPDMRTLQVGLAFIRQQAPVQNQVMAAIVLSVIPVVIAFLLAQKQFIAGIAAGAVKE